MAPPTEHEDSTGQAGVLLVNLGTPDAPRTPEVRRYLREFLGDPFVLDIAAPLRWLLSQLVIPLIRAPKSAEAYRQVWDERGSPLLAYSLDLRDRMREELPLPVELVMRYGSPTIAAGLEALARAGVRRVLVAPLYPQYAESSTETALVAVREAAARMKDTPSLSELPPFYEAPAFLDAWAAIGAPLLADFEPDHVLFSYHGLPERHCKKLDTTGRHCFASADCCERIVEANRDCYRAQCFATTAGLRARLELDDSNSSIAFQSRLGRTPWIRPFTDEVLVELARDGVRRLAVFCPSFVADCLETLEEIGIRGREAFREAGGEELILVPSLNAEPAWVEGLAGMLRERL